MKLLKTKLFVSSFLLFAVSGFSQGVTIDSIQATESRCESSGTLKVFASGGSGLSGNYRYEIVGPTGYTRPLQSGDMFTALSPNNYSVMVTDIVDNSTATASKTVTGNYVVMNPGVTFVNGDCISGGATATITPNGGNPPYTYQITNPIPTAVQSSNVFANLVYNTAYTVKIYDSCGNFQTRVITPTTNDNGVYAVAQGCLKWVDCDSFYITYSVNATSPNTHKYPYTFEFSNPDGSLTTKTITSGPQFGVITDTFAFSGQSGDFFGVSISNGCGANNNDFSSTGLSNYLDMVARPAPQCDGTYSYVFDAYDNSNPAACNQPHPATITYTLINASNTIVGTQVNNSSFSSQPTGNGYKIVRSTICGSDTLNFNWAGSPQALAITGSFLTRNVCKDNVVGANLTVSNAIGAVKLVFVSGPASVTLLDGTVHTYNYPDTILNYNNNQIINYLGAGNYKIHAIDACGNIDSITLNVNNSVVRHTTATFTANNGCPFSNYINWTVSSNTNSNTGTVTINPGNYISAVNGSNGSGSYTSLADGTYYGNFNFQSQYTNNQYLMNMGNLDCDVIRDTIIIKPYQNPIFYGPSVTHCSGTQNDVLLLPDMTKGAGPFTYEITAGPETRPAQGTPVFHNLPLGTYTFLMTDVCGNSFQAQKQVSDLEGVAFETIGNTCENGNAQFAAPHSNYVTYVWTRPNGGTYTGDTLTVDPVTSTDTGDYQIMMIVDINGCIDTSNYIQNLPGYCQQIVLPVSLIKFTAEARGTRSLLDWITASEENNTGFAIERSADGKTYVQIGFVNSKAANGNSNVKLTYTYYDDKPLSGRNFYRLKQVDMNGKFTYSNVTNVYFDKAKAGKIYPNPTNDKVTVEAGAGSVISVYNMVGQKVAVSIEKNNETQILNVRHLPAGNYTIQVMSGSDNQNYKLTIVH